MKNEHVNNKKWGPLVQKGLLGKERLTLKEQQQLASLAMANMQDNPKPKTTVKKPEIKKK